jgi:hypothetical protein
MASHDRRIGLFSTTTLRSVGGPNVGLADRQIKVVCSAPGLDRMGDIVVQAGVDLGPFLASPTVFWNHDAAYPIARAVWIGLESGNLTSIAQFPPIGTDETSDRVYRLIKSDIPLDVSIGFIPTLTEPINKNEPWNGTRFLRCELLEWSIVGIGAQRDSRVIGKGLRAGSDTTAARLVRATARKARLAGAGIVRAPAVELDYAAINAAHAEQAELMRRDRAAAYDAVGRMVQW